VTPTREEEEEEEEITFDKRRNVWQVITGTKREKIHRTQHNTPKQK